MPGVKLESDVRFTYWPPSIECQMSSLESDVRFNLLVYMHGRLGDKPGIWCQVYLLASMHGMPGVKP